MLVGDPDELRGRLKLCGFFVDLSLDHDSHRVLVAISRLCFVDLHRILEVLSRHRVVQIPLIITRSVRNLLTHFVCDLAEVDEVIRNVDQLGRGIRTETGNLHAATLVSNSVYCVHKIFIAGDEYCRVITAGQRQHVYCNLNVKVRLSCAVIESLQLFLNDPKTVATHPQEKPLLSLGAHVYARVEEGPQQTSIAQQHTEQFVVVDVDIVKTGGMEKIITVYEYCYSTAMTQLP